MANIYVAPKADAPSSGRDGSLGDPYWLAEATDSSNSDPGDHVICLPGDYVDSSADVYTAENNATVGKGSISGGVPTFLWIEASDPMDKPKFAQATNVVDTGGDYKIDAVAFKNIYWEVPYNRKMVSSKRNKDGAKGTAVVHADWLYFEGCEFHCTNFVTGPLGSPVTNTARQVGFYHSEHLYFLQCSFHHGTASQAGESNFLQFNECKDVVLDNCDMSEMRNGHNSLSV